MLDIGDSIGEDLGFGLGDVFAQDPWVHVIQKAKIDTGLARPDYYNWPVALESDIRTYHPGVVVIMMGANDNQPLITASGQSVPTGTAAWNRQYRQRIKLLMQEVVASGAHAIWVGLPPLQSPAVNSAFALHLNKMAQQLAKSVRGVTYVSSWSTLAGPRGQFVQYKTVSGSVQQIRYSDGVHLAPTGWDLLASALLAPMTHALKINLDAKPLLRVG
ncbi:MAG: SGNH/GDSL hydrolase family protein [Acidimicrobiales bacterium]